MQLKEGSELQSGKYRIIRVLGQGGFGITYLAEHTMLDKLVAIKEFFPKEYCDRDTATSHLTIGTRNSVEIVEMLKGKFIKEARNISRLHHPNIITIHDIFQENETAYYVMEYVEGSSLSEMVKRNGAMPEAEALGYIRKVAKAVGYMHSKSMNHLDLKPANIMVRESDGEPVLIDFGLSKQYDASGDQTSTTPVGISHGFAPIEQYRPGGVSVFTPQTDIYALGATLFNLLSGQVPPHYSDILEDGLPELPESVSQRIADAIEHAMEIKKNKRPATIEAFVSEIYGDDNTGSKSSVSTSNGIKNEESRIHITPKNITQNSHISPSDATIFIGDSPLQKNVSSANAPIIINGVEFIDLGLSVRWANMNVGASEIDDSGTFFSKKTDGNLNELYQWNTYGAIVPTKAHFEELIKMCSWEWTEIGDTMGYIIVGPNGNSIALPISGDNLSYPGMNIVTFGLLWTNEALLNAFRNEGFLLYFNASTYALIYYSTKKMSPIRLVYNARGRNTFYRDPVENHNL